MSTAMAGEGSYYDQVRAIFQSLDSNRDGSISRLQLVEVMGSLGIDAEQAAELVKGAGASCLEPGDRVNLDKFLSFVFGSGGSRPECMTKGTHVAVVGAGFVGANTAYSLLSRNVAARVTLTDVNESKCQGEVLDLQDSGRRVEMATPQQAGQADVIIITAGRGLRPGETRLDLVKANSGILKSVIAGMQPLNMTAKLIVVSNPCDALTYSAQQCSGLPESHVMGAGTVLDTMRLRVALAQKVGVHHSSVDLWVLGEHGDSQFPVGSMGNIGGVPLTEVPEMKDVDLAKEAEDSAKKAYGIRKQKGYTGFGVATATVEIVDAILNDLKMVLPVSVRVPGRKCVLSLPAVIGVNGVEDIIDVVPHFTASETERFRVSCARIDEAIANLD